MKKFNLATFWLYQVNNPHWLWLQGEKIISSRGALLLSTRKWPVCGCQTSTEFSCLRLLLQIELLVPSFYLGNNQHTLIVNATQLKVIEKRNKVIKLAKNVFCLNKFESIRRKIRVGRLFFPHFLQMECRNFAIARVQTQRAKHLPSVVRNILATLRTVWWEKRKQKTMDRKVTADMMTDGDRDVLYHRYNTLK